MVNLFYNNTKDLFLDGEIWLPIVGYEGKYEVSNLGRVKSVARYMGRNYKYWRDATILKQVPDMRGYMKVCLKNFDKIKVCNVGRLVGIHFIPNPNNKRTINHKKGIKTDNRATELEWATDSEQLVHSYKVLNRKSSWEGKKRGEMGHRQKEKIRLAKIGVKGKNGKLVINEETGVYYDSVFDAAMAHNYKRRTLSAMLNGQNKNKSSIRYV